ncbi:MAG: hypothetical protein ACRDHF_09620 [Tepidiformaceae bacterium]
MVERLARMAAGPLVVAGFFLPWAQGPSVLASETYSGFELVGFAGRLQALDLGLTESAALWSVRLLILGVAIAAAWHTVLAPAARWHFGYPLSGWYLGITGGIAAGLGIWRAGIVAPPLGLAMWLAGGALFVGCEVVGQVVRRTSASVSERATVQLATPSGVHQDHSPSPAKSGEGAGGVRARPVADAPGSDVVGVDTVATGR